MYEISKVDNESIELVRKFLMSVPSINDLDDSILKNAIYIEDNKDIVGAISYEKYDEKGVIRYFVFKRVLEENVIEDLFKKLKAEARDDKILKLYCVVNNDMIEELFRNLGFNKIENQWMFIDEKPFQGMNVDNARVMEHELILTI